MESSKSIKDKLGVWLVRVYKQTMDGVGGGLVLSPKDSEDIIGLYPLAADPEQTDADAVLGALVADAEQDAEANGPGRWVYHVYARKSGEPTGPRFTFPIYRPNLDITLDALTEPMDARLNESQADTARRHLENMRKIDLAGDAAKQSGWTRLVHAQDTAIARLQQSSEECLAAFQMLADRRMEIQADAEYKQAELLLAKELGEKTAEVTKLVGAYNMQANMEEMAEPPTPAKLFGMIHKVATDAGAGAKATKLVKAAEALLENLRLIASGEDEEAEPPASSTEVPASQEVVENAP